MAWWDILQAKLVLPAEFNAAMRTFLTDSKYYPTPAEILSLVKSQREETFRMRETQAQLPAPALTDAQKAERRAFMESVKSDHSRLYEEGKLQPLKRMPNVIDGPGQKIADLARRLKDKQETF